MAKKEFVEQMFNDIAPTYDKLNHILSLNVDKSWRKKAVRRIAETRPDHVLDIACGTGDFSIALAQAGVPKVTGIDISEGMLEVGRRKVSALGLDIRMQADDSEHLSFPDRSFDAVSVAFGVRNFEHLQAGLSEMHRVLRPDGLLCIVELSVPGNPFLLWCYKLYFLHILPFVGGLMSGNRDAYRYLPASVLHFPKPDQVCRMLREAGFHDVEAKAFTFGLCRMFTGKK
ncbi:MAG: bifunctional demethylmenaquinone methyltransferase/2-methoxy-6-polyprenyl-1,4-benzoquinol methylase UbiE [Bacteroidales bacterium]|nr:bifunctional demethylmenaquinone methyltransferase/2-methoxy-6-polyprenyl-1,4-benzoquinol methylase UbiE [Bacteroidales bacterium]